MSKAKDMPMSQKYLCVQCGKEDVSTAHDPSHWCYDCVHVKYMEGLDRPDAKIVDLDPPQPKPKPKPEDVIDLTAESDGEQDEGEGDEGEDEDLSDDVDEERHAEEVLRRRNDQADRDRENLKLRLAGDCPRCFLQIVLDQNTAIKHKENCPNA